MNREHPLTHSRGSVPGTQQVQTHRRDYTTWLPLQSMDIVPLKEENVSRDAAAGQLAGGAHRCILVHQFCSTTVQTHISAKPQTSGGLGAWTLSSVHAFSLEISSSHMALSIISITTTAYLSPAWISLLQVHRTHYPLDIATSMSNGTLGLTSPKLPFPFPPSSPKLLIWVNGNSYHCFLRPKHLVIPDSFSMFYIPFISKFIIQIHKQTLLALPPKDPEFNWFSLPPQCNSSSQEYCNSLLIASTLTPQSIQTQQQELFY